MKELILAMVVLGLLGLLVFRVVSEPRYLNLTEEEIRSRVRDGMTQEEVRSVFGEPTWVSDANKKDPIIWTYFNSRKTYASSVRPLKISVCFKNGVVELTLTEQSKN